MVDYKAEVNVNFSRGGKMFWRKSKSGLETTIQGAVSEALGRYLADAAEQIAKLGKVPEMAAQVAKLKEELADLKTRRAQEEREIQHKLGLHKLQVEAEAKIAKDNAEATEQRLKANAEVSVREAKVVAREEAMKRADELLGEQVSRMERLVEVLVQALPTATLFKETK